MGHNTLGVLPRSRRWQDVVGMLDSGAADRDVFAASARAAENDMLRAAHDPVYVEAVRLLLNIPLAARSDDFGQALRDTGLSVGVRPELLDLVRNGWMRCGAKTVCAPISGRSPHAR